MTSRSHLPPDLDLRPEDFPDLAPGDLAPPWHLAEESNPLAATPPPDPARIQTLRAALARTTTNGSPRSTNRLPLRRVMTTRAALGMAATVALLVAVGVYLWQQPVTVTAPHGALTTIDLPDGSQVQLNSGSTVVYARRFDADARRVRLQGEAFFDVAPAGTPFVLETFNADVQVLGTSFNVRAWPGDPSAETVVSVVTGIVRVAARKTPEGAIQLQAGETASIGDDAATPLVLPDPTVATAWREGRFVFFNQPLGVMFDEIARRYGIEIVASDRIRGHVHNIKTTDESAQQLVHDLCQSVYEMSLRYRTTANGFEIFEE